MLGFRVQKIGRGDGERKDYLLRVHLTPWDWWPFKKRLYLHVFSRPDGDDHPHDHPFPFRSIILWGGYTEEVFPYVDQNGAVLVLNKPIERIRRRWLSSHKASAKHVHRIAELHARKVVTLVIREPKQRDWGFYVHTFEKGVVKVPWWTYVGLPAQPPSAYED